MAGTTELLVTFPGGKRVDAQLGSLVIRTDQPERAGGAGSAPTPYELFLASVGTCAGIFVLGFCQQRGLPTDGIRIAQRAHHDPETGALTEVELDVEVPASFPEKYRDALVRVADQCKVKKAIQTQPPFRVRTVVR
ncbi:MAG TPA: OsmC family protein [Anaeromyxobacteraceae bacterium]|jgi:ribosomal protein S12 methylthiotransferase accessory factor|nr:OsmC family protein [Anaeromyxobacteraceae bacterium]